MKIIFISIILNNHQVGVADRLYELTKGEFKFIETGNGSPSNRKGGGDYSKRPYLRRAEQLSKSAVNKMLRDADVVIYGAAPIKYFKIRVKTGKLTFLYSERWFKQGIKNIFSPRLIQQQLVYHLYCHGKPVYALCASSYGSKDFRKLGSFKGKCFKWGYFPVIKNLDHSKLLEEVPIKTIKILWVGRFISWKHPETMLKLASRLYQEGEDYQITMIGDGYLRERMEKESIAHNYNIMFLGSQSNENVQKEMQSNHIFCFTSDRQEGWGAVLNEAMGNGCCPISSVEAGATLFLVKNGYNGFTYSYNNFEDFNEKILSLIKDKNLLKYFRINAYNTIHELWNAECAANNLYYLSKELIKNKNSSIVEGPCSKA